MKFFGSDSAHFDRTALLFTVLLIAAGLSLLLGSNFGIFSLDHLAKYWPVAIVAAGLVQLLTTQDSRQS